MSRLYPLLLCLFALAGVACEDPCAELSNQVCACEPTESRQQTCMTEVEADADADPPTDAEQDKCEAILAAESCNCDNLAQGNLAACGLAEQRSEQR